MPKARCLLPGFRTACLSICVLYVLMAGSILLRGAGPSMAPFGVPAETLASPHYADAIFWIYFHMLVIGLMIGVLGLYAKDFKLRQVMSRLLLGAHICYTWMDFRASDLPFGTGLYHGPTSLMPAIVSLIITILFVHLSFCPRACAGHVKAEAPQDLA